MKTYCTLLFFILLPFIVGVSISVEEDLPSNYAIGSINPNHLDGAFTGGFGEETCRSCHFDYELNMDGGSLLVHGFDDPYEPGEERSINVSVQSDRLEIGGFQMTARFENGTQAGLFKWEGDRLMFTPDISGDVQYVQHSEEGTESTDDREVSWSFTWIAPESDETVIVNVAANAGNYDDSSFGDWIYAKEIKVNASVDRE